MSFILIGSVDYNIIMHGLWDIQPWNTILFDNSVTWIQILIVTYVIKLFFVYKLNKFSMPLLDTLTQHTSAFYFPFNNVLLKLVIS